MFSLSDISAAPCLCMGRLKVWGEVLNDVWDNLFQGFWSNCPLDDYLPDCPFDHIVEILDAKKPKFFPNINCKKYVNYGKVKV